MTGRLICFALFSAMTLVVAGTSRSSDEFPVVAAEALELGHHRAELGRQLRSIVQDEQAPLRHRVRAARLLGQLGWRPAIDVLIENVSLADSLASFSGNRFDLTRPLTKALATYGETAVPEIVDACLNEPNEVKRVYLFFAIRYGDTAREAFRYLEGSPPAAEAVLEGVRYKQLRNQLKASMEQ